MDFAPAILSTDTCKELKLLHGVNVIAKDDSNPDKLSETLETNIINGKYSDLGLGYLPGVHSPAL